MRSEEEIRERIKEMQKDRHLFAISEQVKFKAGILALKWVLNDDITSNN